MKSTNICQFEIPVIIIQIKIKSWQWQLLALCILTWEIVGQTSHHPVTSLWKTTHHWQMVLMKVPPAQNSHWTWTSFSSSSTTFKIIFPVLDPQAKIVIDQQGLIPMYYWAISLKHLGMFVHNEVNKRRGSGRLADRIHVIWSKQYFDSSIQLTKLHVFCWHKSHFFFQEITIFLILPHS